MKSPGPERPGTYVFGRFRLSVDSTLLLRDGVPVVLAPKVLRTLVVLVERAGQVVGKADLLQAVWPDSVVEETGLTRNISLLRQALGDEGSALVITVPRIGYRFAARVTRVGTPTASPGVDTPAPPPDAVPGGKDPERTEASRGVGSLVLRSGLAVVGIGALAALSTGWLRESSHPPMRVRPITSEPGPEWCPALSPDGKFIAYSDQQGIYVKLIDGGEPLRVASAETAGGAAAVPAWSPDGRQIAFFRHHETGEGEVIGEVFVVPALGGPARKLTSRSPGIDPGLSWSPDQRLLAYPDRRSPREPAAIVLYSLETGERRRITNPTRGLGDSLPRFSPDGRSLAFARANFLVDTDLYVVALDGGEERRLTEGSFYIRGLDWAPDGSIVFSSMRKGGAGRFSLWRAWLSGGQPELLEFGEEGQWPSISLRGNRVAYMRLDLTRDIWRVGGPRASKDERSSRRLASSSQFEGYPQYSPDGTQVAFVSRRAGAPEIWVSDSEGSNPRQLTFLDAVETAHPQWSPDGQWIAFSALERRDFEAFVVSVRGGVPRQLTREGGAIPTAWSRDGGWVYFSSSRSGRRDLWKVPSDGGGEAVQVTRHGGGLTARESSDGQFLFFSKKHPWQEGEGGLWRIPVDGGEETLVLDQVTSASWAFLDDAAVLHMERLSSPHRLRLFDLPTGEVTWSATLDVLSYSDRPSISPDGRFVLYGGVDRVETDVMLVDDFE